MSKSYELPFSTLKKFVNVVDKIDNQRLYQSMKIRFDKSGIKIEWPNSNNDNKNIVVLFHEKVLNFDRRISVNNDASKFISFAKAAVNDNRNMNVVIDSNDGLITIDEIATGVQASVDQPDLEQYKEINQRDVLIRMSGKEFVDNFEELLTSVNSMTWKTPDLAGVSIMFEQQSAYKSALSLSNVVIDDIFGDVDESNINRKYNHSKGHFLIDKNVYNLIKSNITDTSILQFQYTHQLGEVDDSSFCYKTFLVIRINGDYYYLSVSTRERNFESYKRFTAVVEKESDASFNIKQKDLFNVINKIHCYQNFESETLLFELKKDKLVLKEINVDDIATLNITSSSMSGNTNLAFGLNVYVLYNLLRYINKDAVLSFSLKKLSDEEQNWVIKNDKSNRINIVHSYN